MSEALEPESVRAPSLWVERSERKLSGWLGPAMPVLLVLSLAAFLLVRDPQQFLQDDMLQQYLPASRDIARALVNGEWPLLTPYAFLGAPLAAEYQHAVFSVVELLLGVLAWSLKLSLAGTAAVLVLTHLSILAAGAFQLATWRGLERVPATMVSVIACLNGWMMHWANVNWYPALTSFAWMPWAWWSMERLLRAPRLRPGLWLQPVLFVYCILTAGWLFSCAMVALLTGWLVLTGPRTIARLQRVFWLAAAWVAALGLAFPAFALLFDLTPATQRVTSSLAVNRGMVVALEGLLGMALPSYHTYWTTFFSAGIRRSPELMGALVPAACLAIALLRDGTRLLRSHGPDLLLVLVCTLLATSPSIDGLRASFRWLPLFHLSLALVGGAAWSQLHADPISRRSRTAPAVAALGGTAFVWVRALLLGYDASPLSGELGAWLVALALAWWLAAWLGDLRGTRASAVMLAYVIASLVASYELLPPPSEVSRWTVAGNPKRADPLERDRRYLSVWTYHDLSAPARDLSGQPVTVLDTGGMLTGYVPLYGRVQALHGYSSMGERALTFLFDFNIHAENMPGHPQRLLTELALGGGLLELAAVDGLIVAEQYAAEIAMLEAKGWSLAARVPRGAVLHRNGPPSPRVRSIERALRYPSNDAVLDRLRLRSPSMVPSLLVDETSKPGAVARFAKADVKLIAEERNRSLAHVTVPAGGKPALIVFSRPWLPGWRAQLDGAPLDVTRYDGFLPAVPVPAGAQGIITLAYWPEPLTAALCTVAFSALGCALVYAFLARKARTHGALSVK